MSHAVLLHSAFSAVARRYPATVAVLDADRALTYRELDTRSDEVAGRLAGLGVEPGVVVGLLLERSVEAVRATLAVLKAGGAVLPLDPAYPDAQLRRMVQTAGAALLVAADEATGRGCDPAVPTVAIGDLTGVGGPPRARPRAPRPDHLAYVTHTSGSTHHPKAVGVSQHSITVCAEGWLDTYGLRGRPLRHLQCAGFSFDVFIQDLARCLLSGGTLVVCPPAVRLDPPALVDLLTRHDIDFAEFTPALLLLLTEYLELAGRQLPGMRMLAVGGEAWTVHTYHRLTRVVPNAVIVNTYGLAESTIDNLAHVGPPPADLPADRPMPLGRPHPGTELVVVDVETGTPVTAGVGELCLAGACLSEGYLGQPGLTAQRFVAHPTDPGRRVLRTGDLVRVDDDGMVHYLGRRDDQVKIRGVRVMRGEVESVLATHPEVRQAAVVSTAGATGTELVAYIVPAAGGPPGMDELRRLVRRSLAAEAAPSRIIALDALPVTANGKIDRSRLADPPPRERVTPARGANVPDVVAAAWRDTLGRDRFDPGDDYFAMGGDSVAAARVAMRVGLLFGTHIPAVALHEQPTFAGFVDYVTRRSRPAPVLAPRGDRASHPLDPGQRRLWLLSQLHPERTTYVVPTVVDMVGELDRDALPRALRELVARHEPLRTVIVNRGTGPICHVLEPGPVPVATEHADDLAGAHAAAARFLRRPFVLTDEPPIRVQLIVLGPRRHWLVLAVHHIATDGESTRIILDELGRLYDAALTGSTAGFAPLALTYGDVATWRGGEAATARLGGRLDYWRHTLRGHVDGPLALDGPDPQRAEGLGPRHTGWLGARRTSAVRTVARDHRTTVFATLLAAFAELIGRWSGSADVCIGYPTSTRELAATRDLVGFFVDTRVIRVDLSADPSFATLVDRVRAELVGAAAGHGVPFDLIAEAVAADRGHRGPVTRVWFNHLGRPEPPPGMRGLTTSVLDAPVTPALFDINLYVTEHDDNIRVDLVADVARCSSDTGDELLRQYLCLLDTTLADTGAPVRRHRLRTRQAAAVLPDPADPLDIPPPAPMARRLARQARTRATATAVYDDRGEYSYRRLSGAVQGLARALRTAGVRPGDVVALYARRSAGLVAAMLAVLGAGGRLMMLDPGYPTARLATFLSVARPRCVLVAGTEPPPFAQTPGVPVELSATDRVLLLRPAGSGGEPTNLGGAGYVAFTSGTTGAPVGVAGGLPPVAHFLDWYATEFRLGPADRFALLAGLSHDPLFRDVLAPLWVGGTLAVPPLDTYRTPAALLAWLRHERITVVHLTPLLARLLLAAAAEASARLPALRLICLAGDTVTATDIAGLSSLAPEAVLVNGYGTTETPQLASRHVLTAGGPPALGAGAPGSQLLVVDPAGELCGIGEPGHIVVRGRHLAERLLGRAAQPGRLGADAVPGVRRFRTGDIGSYRPDGSIAFLGRSDDTIKIRGFRATPAEVDVALAGDPRVATSVTIPRPGADGTELVSYVVAAGATPVTPSDLRHRLATMLPTFLVPTGIVLVDRLPLSVNGKVDRSALPPPTVEAPSAARREHPHSPLERRLARLWSMVLGHEHIGVTDNFFDVGGTSLSMLRLHAAILREVDDRVPLLALYQNPSVRALARNMSTRQPAPTEVRRVRSSPAEERTRRLAARRGGVEGPRDMR